MHMSCKVMKGFGVVVNFSCKTTLPNRIGLFWRRVEVAIQSRLCDALCVSLSFLSRQVVLLTFLLLPEQVLGFSEELPFGERSRPNLPFTPRFLEEP